MSAERGLYRYIRKQRGYIRMLFLAAELEIRKIEIKSLGLMGVTITIMVNRSEEDSESYASAVASPFEEKSEVRPGISLMLRRFLEPIEQWELDIVNQAVESTGAEEVFISQIPGMGMGEALNKLLSAGLSFSEVKAMLAEAQHNPKTLAKITKILEK